MPRGEHKILDIAGHRFGRLTAESISDMPYSKRNGYLVRRWLCRCTCGRTVIVPTANLTSGNTTSCGCSRDAKEESLYKYLYRTCRAGARARDIGFRLSFPLFKYLVNQDCFYCGIRPEHKVCTKGKHIVNPVSVFVNGIDRVNNDRGYKVGNCVPCCETCNRAKLQMGIDEFMSWCKRIVAYWNGKKYQARRLPGLE